ncbi:hypothetical protein [Ammoniphilus sp. YIM 78166]|uniref:hypothetical protein n=1 Tax=Ammoniphilus sp. YIM 78166 TaxID=1644106 RepID=UPI001431CEBC|nr:hypothetical protein [Ammoniphilus sp. YIM 78166]
MKRVVLTDELLEQWASDYYDHLVRISSKGITFEQFIERKLGQLRKRLVCF